MSFQDPQDAVKDVWATTAHERSVELRGDRPRNVFLTNGSTWRGAWVARSLADLRREVVVAEPDVSPMYGTEEPPDDH
jgi:hypothetical protein